MRALDWLARHGYTWTTDAGAANAIRHWQRVNGLVIDGLVGSETLRSMGLDRSRPVLPTVTKSRPAARPAQPAAPSVDSSPPPVNEVGDVESIIRDVWPADLANRAVKIATRESNLQPGVSNSCCYGLFQIHWRANRAHLIPLGITDPSQLFDARTNAEAALAIYQLSGWAPWACHGKCQDV
jgi:pimeloyl-ACP methyl ester carboxylesterase